MMHTLVLLHLIFSIVEHRVRMASGIDNDFLYAYVLWLKMVNFSIMFVSLCVRHISRSLKRVFGREIGRYLLMSIRSDGLGKKLYCGC